jgi:hypothetical protein
LSLIVVKEERPSTPLVTVKEERHPNTPLIATGKEQG